MKQEHPNNRADAATCLKAQDLLLLQQDRGYGRGKGSLLSHMVDIGFVAIAQNWFHKAEVIFRALLRLLSDQEPQEAIYIGLAFALLGQGKSKEAIALLQEGRVSQKALPSFQACLLLFEAFFWHLEGDQEAAFSLLGDPFLEGKGFDELRASLWKECLKKQKKTKEKSMKGQVFL